MEISAPVVDREYIDRADLSYESSDPGQNLDQIDRMLQAEGMHRL